MIGGAGEGGGGGGGGEEEEEEESSKIKPKAKSHLSSKISSFLFFEPAHYHTFSLLTYSEPSHPLSTTHLQNHHRQEVRLAHPGYRQTGHISGVRVEISVHPVHILVQPGRESAVGSRSVAGGDVAAEVRVKCEGEEGRMLTRSGVG